tara:strand:- start:1140 stop:1448 length:309 start_codon:yes stop_codon:yes gene_type:complete
MRYNFDEIIKERLENRYLWRSYLRWLLTHKDLTIYAKREFYKDKPFLSLVMKLYFLPYNLLKYFIYISEQHRLDMINKEIQILNEFQVDKNRTKLIDGDGND